MIDEHDLSGSIPFLDISEIKIDRDRGSIIVWAPNGTGKSQLTSALRRLAQSSVMFADVEEGSREFEKKRKRLSVSPGVQKIDDLRAKKASLIDGANIKTMLKKVGVTTQARAGELFQAVVDVRRMAG